MTPIDPRNIHPTERGFLLLDWTDDHGQACSIQESSADPLDRIWLGVTESRMHLTQEDALALIPILAIFAVTGKLPCIAKPEVQA